MNRSLIRATPYQYSNKNQNYAYFNFMSSVDDKFLRDDQFRGTINK